MLERRRGGGALCADAEGGASVSGKALSVLGRQGTKGSQTKYEFGFDGNRAAWSC